METDLAQKFTYVERDLATEFGLAPSILKTARKGLGRDIDWAVIRGFISYSEEGRARLMVALKITAKASEAADPVPPPPAPAEEAPRAAEPVVEELICLKRYPINRRIVEAKRGPEVVRVRLRDNVNMRPGMAMRCRQVDGTLWELVQKLPRWPGKW